MSLTEKEEELTPTQQYILSKNWSYRLTSSDREIETDCPECGKERHLYVNVQEGAFHCKVCGFSGSKLHFLKLKVGDFDQSVMPIREATISRPATFPDIEACHQALIDDDVTMCYLLYHRKLSDEAIEKFKLGVKENFFPKLGKNCKALLIPYLKDGSPVYIKYRSLPPEEKAFDNVGSNIPMFNEEIITPDLESVIIVEGEIDALTCFSFGFTNVVAVPGANNKKASWIKMLDESNLKTIYLLYDNDKPGQDAAKEMAIRIGLDKVKNIVLPDFTYKDPAGVYQKGKDINEWFCQENDPLVRFEELVAAAKPFGVEGIQSMGEVIDELEQDAKGNRMIPPLDSPWPSVNTLIGGCEYGDVIGIVAQAKTGKSSFALQWLDYFARQKELQSLFFCLEMPRKRVLRKWISLVTNSIDEPGQYLTLGAIEQARGIIEQMKADLLLGYTRFKRVDEVFETIYQAKRRYGVQILCFDNLHMLTRDKTHRTEETDVLSKRFKQMAMEFNLLVLLIMQPTKPKEGQITDIYDARGAAALVQDVDVGVSLHRNKKAKMTENEFGTMGQFIIQDAFEPTTLIDFGATRYAPGGKTTLYFKGNISKFIEFDELEQKGPLSREPATDYSSQVY
jgi:5S rRNA maturation endonuclease (ribonuclease M5)/KaiC/GvpD/RAD55 family RecA-like ATPase